MKSKLLRLIAFGAVVASMSFAPAHANEIVYEVHLDGPSEPTASPGTGDATITVDFDLFTMRLEISFADLLGPTTAAHIHCCTAIAGTGTAGVATQQPAFTGFPLGVTSGTVDHTLDMTLASSYNSAFITAHGGTVSTAFAFLIDGFDDGEAYLNIHTSVFPGGEIRGFLAASEAVPEPATLALFGIGLAGLGFSRRRTLN